MCPNCELILELIAKARENGYDPEQLLVRIEEFARNDMPDKDFLWKGQNF